ncbi:glucose-6-phosphate exchanger SLC37A1 isoform X2 [Mirounga leonina]|uniref:glucose-6-phosphate exchanger SLC37A1 isoform X2 n=1 Tax=Mirounga leonina TaxID=9715 RepID=UPI00156C0C73|nr:glucose-6-phosphate exchanger SLC37A1 isoform X2 [Mirounga leonina]
MESFLASVQLSAARSGGDCASRGRGRAVSGGPPAHGRQSPRGGAVRQQLVTGVPAPSPLTAGQTRTETLFCLFLKQSFLFLTTAAPWESDLMGEDVKTAFGAGVGNLLPTCFHGELHRYCPILHEGQVGFSSWGQKASGSPHRQPAHNETDCSWAPFDQDNYQQLLGALDYSFLCAYAIGMYLSGIIGERLPIRYYLTFGMLASGAFTALFGFGYFYNIHSFGFYVVTQIINGLVQTTGWPSVVTCLGNWFGKGRRGLIMGVWNSHTSVGNILGSLIAGYWVSTCWGLSFIVPGVIVAAMGIVCFLFLIEHPKDIACSSSLAAPKGCENGTHRFRLQKQVFTDNKNKPLGVIEFSLCLLFAKLVSYTFLFWLPLYITNVDHLDARQAGELSTLFDVGGIFGGILAGVISDRLEKRASTCGLMLLLAAPTLYIFSTISKMGLEATIAMLLLSGALVSGPYALITTAVSADLGTHKSLKGNSHALATVTAIIDGTGSVGAALGPLLAGLLSPSGWNNVFYMLMFADACALLFLTRLIHKELSCPGSATTDQVLFKEH